jgi:hypothetical protein
MPYNHLYKNRKKKKHDDFSRFFFRRFRSKLVYVLILHRSLSLHLLIIFYSLRFFSLSLLPFFFVYFSQRYLCPLTNFVSARFIHSSYRHRITNKKLDLLLLFPFFSSLPTTTYTICQIYIVERKICVSRDEFW